MPLVKESHAEPIPGYRLISPLGSGGCGEVWKCEAPGGLFKAIKFVYGNTNSLEASRARAVEELQAVQHVKAIRHPFLLSMDRVESVDGELIIVMELADQNLHEVMSRYQQDGNPGIPRRELLGYLREAAEVLDLMNQAHDLQHLDIKPRNLFLVHKHVKVADFGLVSSLGAGAGDCSQVQLGAITPLYAAPEVFQGTISRHSDQYSLAIVFQELLTGKLPFQGQNMRQLLVQHTKETPNLQQLAAHDQGIVGRALAKDPQQRFPSCSEFIHELLAEAAPESAVAVQVPALPSPSPEKQPSPASETISTKGQDTDRNRTGAPAPADLLPDYRFLECLGRTPVVDQWRVQTPDGRQRLLKVLYGVVPSERLQEALLNLRALHHPGLAEFDVVASDPGRVALVTDLPRETLRDRAQQCQARKFPGIIRGELLDYLRSVAETLDYLFQQHSLQHLGLNPRNLVLLSDGRVQVADFGLAQLLWLPAGEGLAQRNSRYSAPELFDGQISRTCDQYSLALIYHEMLAGVHAFSGAALAQGAGRAGSKPSLGLVPEHDRQVLARALSPDSAGRWPSCTALVSALEGLAEQNPEVSGEESDRFAALLSASRSEPVFAPPAAAQENLNQLISELIASVAGAPPQGPDGEAPTLSADGDLLQHRFQTGLPLGTARVKLDDFCQQWYAQLIREEGNRCVFHVSLPSNFWKQWLGRQPGLEIQVQLARAHALSATPIEVAAQVRAFRCTHKRGRQLLEDMGLTIVDSLRSHLLVNSNKRLQDRILWPHPVKIRPVYRDGTQGETVACAGKDISQTGMGFYLPEELDTSEVLIQLPNSVHPPAISVPATLVRAKRTADGSYEVGALFRIPALRKSLPELCVR